MSRSPPPVEGGRDVVLPSSVVARRIDSLVPALRAGLLSGRGEDECAGRRPDPERGDVLVQDASRDDLLQLFGGLFGHGLANVGSGQFRSELSA